MDAVLVAMWAAAVAAIVGPVVSVAMANRFTRHQATRQEAAQAFRRLIENAQNFRHAFLDQHSSYNELRSYPEKLNRLKEAMVVTASAKDTEGQTLHDELQVLYGDGVANQQSAQERFDRAFRETRSIESLLNADKVSLGLLFDNGSERCGRAINDLIAMSEVFNRHDVPPFSECQQRLNELIQQIGREIKDLHDSIRRSDPLSESEWS